MIALFLSIALASPDQVLTADVFAPGRAAIRQPTGPSGVGLTEGVALSITPLDIGIGGPRLGLEQRLLRGPLSLSVTPSYGQKHTGRRSSARLDTTVTQRLEAHRLHATLGVDTRFESRLSLSEEVERTRRVDRLALPLTVVHDWTHRRSTVRTRATLPLLDHGRVLPHANGSIAYQHAFGKLHTETGVGVLVGRPYDHYFLDTYQFALVVPYPKLDLWMVF